MRWGLRSERSRVTVEIGDEGWGEGFWSEMEGEANVEIRDGGWGESFGSEMEGEARVFDRRWRVRQRLRSEIEGEARVFDRRWRVRVTALDQRDGGWDRRWRVIGLFRDRAQGFKMFLRKKKKRRDCPKKIKDKRPMAACIKRGHSSIKKKCGYNSKKRGFRRVL